MKYIWLFSIFVLSQSILADLHYPLGEKDFGHYHGPYDPSLKINYRSGYFEFEDKEYRERFPMDLINQDIYFLKDYYKNYLMLSLKCDDGFYLENRGYIQYLYRLTALSYLYEYLRKIHISLYQLGELEQECSIDFNQVFSRCEPKSKEMKSFVKRLDNHFIDVIDWGRFSFVPKNISSNDFKKFHGETFVNIILKSGKSYGGKKTS